MRLALYKLRETLGNNNIHSATRGKENQTEIIRSYNQAIHELKESRIPEVEREDAIQCDSALLRMAKEGEVGLFAVFGGQGTPRHHSEISNATVTHSVQAYNG